MASGRLPPVVNRPVSLSLRPATGDDASFLRGLYAETRAAEMAATGWPEAVRAVFLHGQYEAQQRSYREQHPDAAPEVILAAGLPVGVLHVARSPGAVRVVNIVLAAPCRGQGWGTALLRDVCAEADRRGVPAQLHVEASNRAQRLYRRLGFRQTGGDGIYLRMERPARRRSLQGR